MVIHSTNLLRIRTNRLVIRPIELAEIERFHAIAKRREIAENLASIPHPMSEEDARQWLAERAYQGQPEFVAGIFKLDETLVGCIGISSNPVTTYYFLASEHWGHGYATEAINPFLDWCAKVFEISEIKVGVLHDNVGSQRVLEKAGFRQTHVARHQPPFRSEPDRLLMYWKGYGASEPLTIGTELLYIHPVHSGHSNRLSEISDGSEKFQLLGTFEQPFTTESAKQWITESMDQPNLHRFAITSAEGRLTGACELIVDKDVGSIKMWIGPKYWHTDYGEDAIHGLVSLVFDRFSEVENIKCRITQENTVLQQVLSGIGFKRLQLQDKDSRMPNRPEHPLEGQYCLSRSLLRGTNRTDLST